MQSESSFGIKLKCAVDASAWAVQDLRLSIYAVAGRGATTAKFELKPRDHSTSSALDSKLQNDRRFVPEVNLAPPA
jgi:hypothetical protein